MQVINQLAQPLPNSTMQIGHGFLIEILSNLNINARVLYDMCDGYHFVDQLLVDQHIDKIDTMGVDLVVISIADHPYDNAYVTEEQWWQRLTEIKTPVIVLHGVKTNHPLEIYCPSWAMLYPHRFDYQVATEQQARNSDRDYIFSCLNNKIKVERLINLIEVYQRYQDNFIVTLNGTNTEWNSYSDSESQLNMIRKVIPSKDYDFLTEHILNKLPITSPGCGFNGNCFDSINPAYTNAYINIVTEFSYHRAFISEKSIKPLVSGQFFLTVAAPGVLAILEYLGIDTFKDIIDHSVYEQLPVHVNPTKRLAAMHDCLQSMLNYDWKDLYEQTATRRIANRNLIISNQIEKNFLKQLTDRIYEVL